MQAGVLSPDPQRLLGRTVGDREQHGLWVPKGTPGEIVLKLDAAIVDALADPAVRKRLTDIGQEIFPRDRQTPEALYAFHKAETERWWPIIKGAGTKNE